MDELRTKVARVIDPVHWINRDFMLQAANTADQRSEAERGALRAQATELVLPSLTKADSILNLIGGDGWKLVPVEPTAEMVDAVWQAAGIDISDCDETDDGSLLNDIYRAMIAASPPPQDTP